MGIQETWKAMSDATRRQILLILKEKPLTAGEIAGHFQMTNATISHHLSVLKEAELISDNKKGKYIYYELNLSVLDEVMGFMISLTGGSKHETKNNIDCASEHIANIDGTGSVQ